MKIPFFDYPSLYKRNASRYDSIIQKVCAKGHFILQHELDDFEEDLAKYTGAKYALGVSNATDGLQMVLMTEKFSNDDEVLFSSHTMIATASAIYHAGAIPIPCEAGYDGLINLDDCKRRLTGRTKGLVITQLNGRTANMESVKAFCDENGLILYEDAAQGLGSQFRGRMAGTFGKASCISFYPAKILGCFGDGGAILTDDLAIYEEVKLLRNHGRYGNNVIRWGFNARLDNIQAAILQEMLKDMDSVITRRRQIAFNYRDKLSNCCGVQLPFFDNESEDHFDTFQNFEIKANNRDKLQEYLRNIGIGTLRQWDGKPVHQFHSLGFNQDLPETDKLFEKLIMLPMNVFITDEDVNFICSTIRDFYDE